MPEFAEVKQRQAAAWSAGAFEAVAPSIADVHAALVEALAPQAGESWLDVGSGAGHVAELAAAAGAKVTGIDLSPRLVEVAKGRAEAGGYDIDYRVGDAEHLDVDDASFDIVSSSFGMIFAPDHDAAAHELARATKQGSRLGFSAWTPEGTIGDMFKVLAQFQPPPPEGAGGPLQWGSEEHVHDKLGEAFDLTIERRVSRGEEESLDAFWAEFSTSFGPLKLMLESSGERRDELEAGVRGHFQRFEQPDGLLVEDRDYLLITGIRR
ncbi:MAG: class I SAM-dependent methyltransferase [Gaiellaceae bacterium]